MEWGDYIAVMKQILVFFFVVSLSTAPLAAGAQTFDDDGVDLMQEGAQLLLRGLLREMEPAFTDIQKLAEDMGPALTELLNMVDDLRQYHAPEFLPNGDIIIRRRADAPDFDPVPEIEL